MRTTARTAGYRRDLLVLAIGLSLLAVFSLSAPALAAPSIKLNPDSGAPGIKATVTGTVFDSYKGDIIHIYFDSIETDGSPVTVPETGTFSAAFTVPVSATPGPHRVRVTSGNLTSSVLAEASFMVETPAVALDFHNGHVGTGVIISGSGFPAGGVVSLTYDVIGLGTEAISSDGRFTHGLAVPESIGGPHRVSAADGAGHYAETFFTVVASIKINMFTGAPGEVLNVKGSGFGYRSNVNVLFGTSYLAAVASSDFGSFDAEVTLPDIEPGPYTIIVSDGAGNQDNASFLLGPSVNVSPSSAAVGALLTVRGKGFRPGGTVTADFDSQRAGSASADFNGAFTISFNVPVAAAGEHAILVSDGDTTRQVILNIESDAPPAPVPVSPGAMSPFSFPWNITQPFSWLEVEEPSQPVVYTFEIAADESFKTPLLLKTGLSEPQYILAENETLKAGFVPVTYFWRVMATDAAGNKGQWSEPQPFSISAPPPPIPVEPAAGSRPESPVIFTWRPVDSTSPPIIYTLQVATKEDFRSPVLEKTGLSAAEYAVPEEAPLLRGGTLYYWRVQATDFAGNFSDWSPVVSFTAGSSFRFPAWAIYTLIGAVAAVGIFLAYYLGKNRALRPPEQPSGPGDVI